MLIHTLDNMRSIVQGRVRQSRIGYTRYLDILKSCTSPAHQRPDTITCMGFREGNTSMRLTAGVGADRISISITPNIGYTTADMHLAMVVAMGLYFTQYNLANGNYWSQFCTECVRTRTTHNASCTVLAERVRTVHAWHFERGAIKC